LELPAGSATIAAKSWRYALIVWGDGLCTARSARNAVNQAGYSSASPESAGATAHTSSQLLATPAPMPGRVKLAWEWSA
jgi:hypothetical protein